jgi:hypothetical protein
LLGASEPRWLAPGIAADLFFTPDPDAGDRAAADARRRSATRIDRADLTALLWVRGDAFADLVVA